MNTKAYRYFHVVAMFFVASMLISNTIAVKVISIFGYTFPAGIILFPVAYIVNDVLAEVYGFEKARSVIWWGFIALALMTLCYFVAIKLPYPDFYENQQAFDAIFKVTPRIALGSFLGYLFGSFLNSMTLSKMKVRMKGKKLYMRTIGSTIVGEGADSIIFNLVAFYGVYELNKVLVIALSGFIFKVVYETLATPLTYLVVGKLKKLENEDKFDVNTNYNLF